MRNRTHFSVKNKLVRMRRMRLVEILGSGVRMRVAVPMHGNSGRETRGFRVCEILKRIWKSAYKDFHTRPSQALDNAAK